MRLKSFDIIETYIKIMHLPEVMFAFREHTIERLVTALGIVGVILALLGIITLLFQIIAG